MGTQEGVAADGDQEPALHQRHGRSQPRDAGTEAKGQAESCPMSDFEIPAVFANHPGGQLSLATGRRAKCPGLLFLSYHMGSDMEGKVELSARALGLKLPERGAMAREMNLAIRQVKLDHPEVHHMFIAYCLMLTAILPFLFFWWMIDPGVCNSLVSAVVFELYFLNVFHTRHHQGGNLYQNKTLQRLTNPFYDFIESTWGYYPYAWRFNHHVKHHVYTNDSEIDSDVPSMWPLVRSCHDKQRLWFHKFQTFYWPLLMPFTAVSFPVANVMDHGGSPLHFLAWLTLMGFYPVLVHGWRALFLSFLTLGFAGGSLAYKFAVSHAHENLRNKTTTKESYDDADGWLSAQIEESMSYGGFLTTLILGGINMQIEHHIAPALDPPLYYYVAPEIKRISQKYGVKYTDESSFWHAVFAFHWKLWSMGWAP